LTIFQDHVRAMRQWMADHGQRNKPLIITEYGILFLESSGYDLNRVRTFFVNTANWLLTASDSNLGYPADDNHLVQRWMWYSLDDNNFENAGNTVAALMDPATQQLRPMGQVFADLVTPLRRPYVNLVAARVRLLPAAGALSASASSPVSVEAIIQNRGNTATSQSFRVVIEDQARAVIHTTTIGGMPARYGGNTVVQTSWQKPAGTNWRLTVRVDPEGAVGESDESDNQLTVTPSTDLDVQNLTLRGLSGQNAGWPTAGSVDVVAQVANRGGMNLSEAVARFWDNGRLAGQKSLPDLAPGAQTTVTFAWTDLSNGLHDLAVDTLLPSGVTDPVADNNRIGRSVLLVEHRAHLPMALAPRYQSGQPLGVTCANALTNPSFESGNLSGWTATPSVGLMSASCFDGRYCLWLGSSVGGEDDIYQAISIRPGATLHLNFAWAVVTSEGAPERRDTLAVEIRSATGQLLKTAQTLDNRNAQPYWATSDMDLNEFAGQTIQLHFRGRNDSANLTYFFVDKVNLEVCEQQ
jgi:hypothetical protein